jgi:hypothetical protein
VAEEHPPRPGDKEQNKGSNTRAVTDNANHHRSPFGNDCGNRSEGLNGLGMLPTPLGEVGLRPQINGAGEQFVELLLML